jgi:uncharacterized protein (DUF1015 family)
VPRFEPFRALRYAATDLAPLVAPPYDVLSESDLDELEARDPHNIVHVDVPRERDGASRYEAAAARLRGWLDDGVMVRDEAPSFTLYRMRFTDEAGRAREIVGVMGALEIVDEGAGGVLPHERTTPKASTDRLDLTRATEANLSPVWGLALARGLTDALAAPGERMGSVTVDGVEHSVERVVDPARLAEIGKLVGSDDVLIADGHHRYSISRTYRDEARARTSAVDSPAELILAFVSELADDQLSVAAIHRIYRGIDRDVLVAALGDGFELSPAGAVYSGTPAEMLARGCLCLVDRDGTGTWLEPRPGAFDEVRALDGAWLEHVVATTGADVAYQHGVDEVLELLRDDPSVAAAVLIRPVSVSEIERTAREGLLMPPKSTFFTPKLRTGFVVRELA